MEFKHKELQTRAVEFLRTLQDEITTALERLDGTARFRQDEWDRPGGGGGRTRVMSEGAVFEKAGVNFSAVLGVAPQYLRSQHPDADSFFATGVSLVLHPHSPKIPTVHANVRYFELSNGSAWFGGGMDLTPYYLVEEDAIHFHKTLKSVCDKHDPEYYPRFKKWCDEYFYIKHRGESRGVGGIFYDNLSNETNDLDRLFAFHKDVGRALLPAYIPIAESHLKESYTDEEKQWQLLRHGRYVEFNLVYDKGTVFGLETGGRTESILMSLPTLARWEYDHTPLAGSPEAALLEVLRHPVDWASK